MKPIALQLQFQLAGLPGSPFSVGEDGGGTVCHRARKSTEQAAWSRPPDVVLLPKLANGVGDGEQGVGPLATPAGECQKA